MSAEFYEVPVNNISLKTLRGSMKVLSGSYDFYLILNGEVEALVNGQRYYMYREDLMLASPKDECVLSAHGSNLVLAVSFKSSFFQKGHSALTGRFVCNSVTDQGRNYQILRRYLVRLAMVYFGGKDINFIHLNSLAYGLLYYMNLYHYETISFSGGEMALKYQKRMQTILDIMNARYMEPLTLAEMAGELYLSVAYLSRFIKQYFGESFNTCLNRVRLQKAMEQMEKSDRSLTRIANDCGFSNMNTFYRTFKEAYKMTPKEYRERLKKYGHGEEDLKAQILEQDFEAFKDQLEEMAGNGDRTVTPAEDLQTQSLPAQCIYKIYCDTKGEKIRPLWKSMVNLGFADTILNPQVQQQIVAAQDRIGFKYGKIRSVLSDDVIPYMEETGDYNFVKFDRLITFLMSVHLIPMLELGYRGEYMILKGTKTVFKGVHDDENFSDTDIYVGKVKALIEHCIYYFGLEAVEQWLFEINYLEEKSQMSGSAKGFVNRMRRAAQIIKEYAPLAKVGGLCHKVWAPVERFSSIIEQMNQLGYVPDFISLSVIPYEPNYEAKDPMGNCFFSADPSYGLTKVRQIRQLLKEYPKITSEIYVSSLCVDVVPRNALNDSCFQSSFLAKTMIDLVGEVDALGYWVLSDIATEYVDTARFLHGGSGLLNKYGIPKPGYFVLEYMASMGGTLIYKKDQCMVTRGRNGDYCAIMGNYIPLGDLYCMQARRDIDPSDIYSVFEESSVLDVRLEFNHLPLGWYKISIVTINRKSGSLLDCWLESGLSDPITKTEMEYLKDDVHVKCQFHTCECIHGDVKLRMQLLPHEVKFVVLSDASYLHGQQAKYGYRLDEKKE